MFARKETDNLSCLSMRGMDLHTVCNNVGPMQEIVGSLNETHGLTAHTWWHEDEDPSSRSDDVVESSTLLAGLMYSYLPFSPPFLHHLMLTRDRVHIVTLFVRMSCGLFFMPSFCSRMRRLRSVCGECCKARMLRLLKQERS